MIYIIVSKMTNMDVPRELYLYIFAKVYKNIRDEIQAHLYACKSLLSSWEENMEEDDSDDFCWTCHRWGCGEKAYCEHCDEDVCRLCGHDYCETCNQVVCTHCGIVTWNFADNGPSSTCTFCNENDSANDSMDLDENDSENDDNGDSDFSDNDSDY